MLRKEALKWNLSFMDCMSGKLYMVWLFQKSMENSWILFRKEGDNPFCLKPVLGFKKNIKICFPWCRFGTRCSNKSRVDLFTFCVLAEQPWQLFWSLQNCLQRSCLLFTFPKEWLAKQNANIILCEMLPPLNPLDSSKPVIHMPVLPTPRQKISDSPHLRNQKFSIKAGHFCNIRKRDTGFSHFHYPIRDKLPSSPINPFITRQMSDDANRLSQC